MKKHDEIGSNIWLHDNVIMGDSVSIGHGSCIGYTTEKVTAKKTIIGNNVTIGALCVVELGTEINNNIFIDHFCRIGTGTKIGMGSQIKYGVQIFKHVVIGENCVIAGDLGDRTVVEDYVIFQGGIAHSYRDTTVNRSITEEPWPIIKRCSFVGVNALLIGGITIGPRSYIAAGEIVRSDVPAETVVYKGKRYPLKDWRGLIKLKE